jgi:hypothetical protein
MIAMKSGGLKGKERRKIETKSPLTPIFFGKKKKTTFPNIFQYGYLNKHHHHHLKHLHINHKS